MIIGRYNTSELNDAKDLPGEWSDALTNILNATYEDRANKDNAFFDVLGKVFKEETIIIVSYLDKEDYSKSPICVAISLDNIQDTKKFKNTLDSTVKLSSLIYDDIFATEDWSEYVHNWTENEIDQNALYYKITRENFSLTLQAEEILKGNI